MTRLLAGDVGGTKTVLAIVEDGRIVRREVHPSRHHPSCEELIIEFLGGPATRVSRACLGVAGPVLDDVCRATNLPWVIDARALERTVGIPRVALVNDFHALAIGITGLPASDFTLLNPGDSDPRGPWVVIGAGTGLGEAVVTKGPAGYEVISSEGGHTDFGPRSELEVELLRWLWRRYERVSYERVVSGPGLALLYEFLRAREPGRENPRVREAIEQSPEDSPSVVSRHAMQADDPLCGEALRLFVSLYGAEAGNLALKVIARGGVYVAGGIAPKILPWLLDGTFREAFVTKGRLSPLVERTPVRVVLNADAGLLGAAAIAGQLTL